MKLELKHLAPYLPYELKAITTKEGYKNPLYGVIDYWSKYGNVENEISISSDEGYYLCQPHELKPYLRPMSDLYKERNGKIDIVELAKMSLNWDWRLDRFDGQTVARSGESIFFYNDVYNLFELHTSKDKYVAFNQLQLFEYLFANHYDIYGLLDQNLAININEIEL